MTLVTYSCEFRIAKYYVFTYDPCFKNAAPLNSLCNGITNIVNETSRDLSVGNIRVFRVPILRFLSIIFYLFHIYLLLLLLFFFWSFVSLCGFVFLINITLFRHTNAKKRKSIILFPAWYIFTS